MLHTKQASLSNINSS